MRNSWLVAVFLPFLLFAQDNSPTSNTGTQPEEKCVLSGRVTAASTGEPLGKATLHLSTRGAIGDDQYLAISNADGSFQFLNIPAGTYQLLGEHAGFLVTSYGARNARRDGTVLTLQPGQQLTNLTLALMPQGVITGRLIDEDGEPVGTDEVRVLAQHWLDGKLTYVPRAGDQADDRGQFRIADLEPGKYILCAEIRPHQNDEIPSGGKPAIGPVTTFFPSATSMDAATPIEIHSGQELDGIEIHVRSLQTFHVRGKLAGALPKVIDMQSLQLSLVLEGAMDFWFPESTRVKKNGAFDIAGVGPGSYNLKVLSFERGPTALATVPVAVGSSDVNNVVVNLLPQATLHGKVRVEGAPLSGEAQWNATNISVYLSDAKRASPYGLRATDTAKSDGSLALENVTPAAYKVNVTDGPSGTYLKAVRLNGQDLPDKTIDLSEGVSGELEIVFAYGAAEVDGAVQFPESEAAQPGGTGSTAPSTKVVLIADDPKAPGLHLKFGESDQNGSFKLGGVAPGSYHLYAFEKVDPDLLQNPAVVKAIADCGVEVEVKENDKKQVQTPVISEEDLRQILTRLGLGDE